MKVLVWIGLIAGTLVSAAEPVMRELKYAPGPPDNPLKGLVPYAGRREQFPHSMEFSYLPLSALVKGERKYDWQPLEKLLDEISGRGHQAVFRVFLEYPKKKGVIPEYLIERGLEVHRYVNTNTQPLPPSEVETPDYGNPLLREMLLDFIAEMGKRYDGDARIGFITAGLLGTWGEWHTYPRNDLMAGKEVQKEVAEAYEKAFQRTPVLLRYPAGKDDWSHPDNSRAALGYHDDSFAWATLESEGKHTDWYFLSLLRKAGALQKWKRHPIGGEIRPKAWGQVFDARPENPKVQDYAECVEKTHISWVMDSGMFQGKAKPERYRRAIELVSRMGYEFHVSKSEFKRYGDLLRVAAWVENRGVAPMYHHWRVEFGLADATGKVVETVGADQDLTGLLPEGSSRVLRAELKGGGTVLLRVVNPLAGGTPLRFANEEQDADVKGWLSLGTGSSE